MKRNELSVALSDAFPISKVPDHLPLTASGRKLHRHIAFRWALHGVRGIRLRTIDVPGVGKCTTLAWLDEFVSQLNAAEEEPAATGGSTTAAKRSRTTTRPRKTSAILERHGLNNTTQGRDQGGAR